MLRSAYGAAREEIASAFAGVAGLPNVTVEAPGVLKETIAAYREGMDFADALHLVVAREASVAAFATFDKELLKRSEVIGETVGVHGTLIAFHSERPVALMHLTIANKLYSSWSLRPWILMRAFDIPFDETVIPLYQPETKARILQVSPTGKVPCLTDGDVKVWESLAILEYLAEKFPEKPIFAKECEATEPCASRRQ